jgi:hypothetical protein
MSLGLIHEVLGAFRADGMDMTIGLYITPASIRLRIPLERKAFRVMDIPQLKIMVVLEPIVCSPSSTNVVTLVLI